MNEFENLKIKNESIAICKSINNRRFKERKEMNCTSENYVNEAMRTDCIYDEAMKERLKGSPEALERYLQSLSTPEQKTT